MEEKTIHISLERRSPLLYGDCVFKSAQDFSLSRKDIQKAYLELGETEDGRAAALQKIKEKMDSDFKIKYRTDDSYLLRYLRYTKFNVDKAFNLIRKFYLFRGKHPHVFSLSQMENLSNTNFVTYLPYADEDRCIVFWVDFRNWNLDDWGIWQMASLFHAVADIASINPNAQINGIKGVYDLRGLSRRHLALIFNPITILFLIKMLQDIYPLKLKKVVAIHSSPLIQASFYTIRHLMKKKIRDRMEEKPVYVDVNPDRTKPLFYEDHFFKSAHEFSLTIEDYEKARLEVRETEEGKASAIIELRAGISSDETIKYRTDDSYLLRFLRYTKFDIEKSRKLVKRFFNFRLKRPDLFSLSNMEILLKVPFVSYLPYADEEGCIVFWINFSNWDVADWNVWDMVRVYHIIADIVTENPNAQIHGVKGLWDLKDISFSHITQAINLKTAMFIVNMLQDMYPLRLKKIVTIHTSSKLKAILNTIKYILKKKIRDRVMFLGSDLDELHEHYHPAILPKQYGGYLEESECHVTGHVMENVEYLKYERSFAQT